MKTTKLIFALVLSMAFIAGVKSIDAQDISIPGTVVENKARMVTYVARIQGTGIAINPGMQYQVMMTDENGLPVAPPQTYRPGIMDYTFAEGGTIRGTRVAKIVRQLRGPYSTGFYSNTQTGVFYGGCSYLFIIKPVCKETDPETGIQ